MAVIRSATPWTSSVAGSYAYRLTNPDLTWETQEQLNFGIDARFLNNRLGF